MKMKARDDVYTILESIEEEELFMEHPDIDSDTEYIDRYIDQRRIRFYNEWLAYIRDSD